MNLALTTGLPLSDLLTWEPRDLASGLEFLDDQADAMKDAQRGR